MPNSTAKVVAGINAAVTGISVQTPEDMASGGSGDDDPEVPFNQARGLATQNIAQSAAMAIADGVDMMRNVETIMTTAMGVAMAQWIANPANVLYEQIISQAATQIGTAATNFKAIADAAAQALNDFKPS